MGTSIRTYRSVDISTWSAADDAALVTLSSVVDGTTVTPSIGDLAFYPNGSIKRLKEMPHTSLANWETAPGVVSVHGRTGVVTTGAADITDSTATGRALLTASTASAGRLALGLSAVAASGSYNDLTDKPAIPNITATTASNYTNLGASITNGTGLYSTVIGAGINAYSAQRLCVVSSNAVLTSSAAATGSTIVGDNTSVTGSSGNSAVFGRSSSASDGGTALGGYALAKQYSVSVGSYTNGGAYSLSLGYSAGNGSSIANRTEIAPTNNGTITHRLSGQTNGNMQLTLARSDTAPTSAAQAFGNANGTLPQGMYQLQLSADGSSVKVFVNVGGTIKSATLALS